MNRKIKIFNRAAFTLFLLILPLYSYKIFLKDDYTDFLVYWREGVRITQGLWDQLYNMTQDGPSPFRYVPLTLPLFTFLGAFSSKTAHQIWFYLQYLFYCSGFVLLSSSLKHTRLGKKYSLPLTLLSALLVLRFCLDSFTIGQVSGLMFFGYSLALWGWMRRSPWTSGIGLLIPALLKIGPGFLYLLRWSGFKKQLRYYLSPLLTTLILSSLTLWWLRSTALFLDLWKRWFVVVYSDSLYYDASHYGSQSLKSFLLRAIKSQLLTINTANQIYLFSLLIICFNIFMIWLLRRPRGAEARGLFFSLGIFPFLWFMPETFKYALTTLAFPLAFIICTLSHPQSSVSVRIVTYLILGLNLVFLSFAGKDLLPNIIFFRLQEWNLPFVSYTFLGFLCGGLAYRYSQPSSFYIFLKERLSVPRVLPWETLPVRHPKIKASLLLPLRLDTQSTSLKLSKQRFKWIVEEHLKSLKKLWDNSFEIILIPYGNRKSLEHPLILEYTRLAQQHTQLKQFDTQLQLPIQGHGEALREGFIISQGDWILCNHLEQPAHPEFFVDAHQKIQGHFQFIHAHRRHHNTKFIIPVAHLPQVYSRHRLGVILNKIFKILLKIHSDDSHSGVWLTTRQNALRFFFHQAFAGFYFDLEIFKTLLSYQIPFTSLPIRLYLEQEKPVRRVLGESLKIITGFIPFILRCRAKAYQPTVFKTPLQNSNLCITADDWGISKGVNDGILELSQQKVLRRVSLLADSAFTNYRLLEIAGDQNLQLGFHFNVTYHKKYKSPSQLLLSLLIPGEKKQKSLLYIQEEFQKQWQEFESRNLLIQTLEAHHHAHIFPGVLNVLKSHLKRTSIQSIRCPLQAHKPFQQWLSTHASISLLSVFLRNPIARLGYQSSPFYYPLHAEYHDPALLLRKLEFLHQWHPGGIEILCHPSRHENPEDWKIPDTYILQRMDEFRCLAMMGEFISREISK